MDPWEVYLAENSGVEGQTLITGSGIEAPAAQNLNWSARNVGVESKFELAIPIIVAGEALVRFKFTTTGGDICFSANFFAIKESSFDVSTLLRERTREQSQREKVEGEIKVARSGTLRLTWDNLGAPWRLERRLSYNVELFYPGSETMLVASKQQARGDLLTLSSTRQTLGMRQTNLAEFLGRCGATEEELSARLAQVEAELAAVRQTTKMASDLARRIGTEARALRNSTVAVVLNLVLREGWLVIEKASGSNQKVAAGNQTQTNKKDIPGRQ
eukprot:CAMPEP_0171913324 /NCGR_PEP_ID=MMETSP0993-20121228/11659_1 /TAXON_ID=483369 /ORGANISM="non described non described, Strain CCMP2098" /LENGTH=272 /DNA_ID=CAMNT_0012547293 /DNA_START=63 /DNA_END=881 /DNA_ORIENTATION=-